MMDENLYRNFNGTYIVYVCVCVCVTYNKGVGPGFRDVYNSYRIMTKRLLPKQKTNDIYISTYITQL